MASRVIEAGSVVARTRFLLLTRVLKERPLWLDVAGAFPPVDPLPPPHKARHLHWGRPRALSYTQDVLKRDFPKHYIVVTKEKLEPAEEIYSLNEEDQQNSLNLIDQFVREQSKEIANGLSWADAGAKAIVAVKDYHPTLTVLPIQKETESEVEMESAPVEDLISIVDTLK